MNPPLPEDRAARGKSNTVVSGYTWAARATNIGLQMILPGIGGYYLDRWLGTTPWLLVVGVILGFVSAMFQLVALANRANPPGRKSPGPPNG